MTDLLQEWASLDLPEHWGRDLLVRWDEPHRRYHTQTHLRHGLRVLRELQAPAQVRLAWWFHDAVHHNDTPNDERASADLLADMVAGRESPAMITEMCRLVLLTIDHQPGPGDLTGAMICDADLHSLTLPPAVYRAQVNQLRQERPDWGLPRWQAGRIRRVQSLLGRSQLFHTDIGQTHWEEPARQNLSAELSTLLISSQPPASDPEGPR